MTSLSESAAMTVGNAPLIKLHRTSIKLILVYPMTTAVCDDEAKVKFPGFKTL